MNKKKSPLLHIAKCISVLLMLGTFLFLFIFCTFLPRTTQSRYDTLTPFPEFSFESLFDGSYTEQLSAYFSDTVFGRDHFKIFYAKMSSWFGKETVFVNNEGIEEIIIGPGTSDPNRKPLVSTDSSSSNGESPFGDSEIPSHGETSSAVTSGEESTASSEGPHDSSEENHGTFNEELCEGILILGTRAIEIYYGDPNLNVIPRFANALNNFAEKNANINVYSMVIPKSSAYYISASQQYGHLANRTLNDTNALNEHLSEKVTPINVYDALKLHADEDIYFRTDHHWTALGAYYAAKQFATQLGLPFEDLSTYEKNVRTGYLGTMDTFTSRHPLIHENPEDFITYVPKATYKATFYKQNFQDPFEHSLFFKVSDNLVSSWYLTFINGDSYSVKVESDMCNNGRKLLIVKDSYGNALAPYLLYSFEEIYIVDARAFEINLNTFVTQQGITDVLFAECALSVINNPENFKDPVYLEYLERLTK